MATFAYSFTFANASTADGGNIQTDMNDLRTFLLNNVAHSDGANYPTSLGTFGCRARRVANQSIPNNSATAISWDTIDSDLQTMISGATVTVKSAGWYMFSAYQSLPLTTTTPVFLKWHFTLGPTLMPLIIDNEDSSSRDLRVVATCIHKCALNETIQAQILQTTGVAQNINAWMFVRKISAL